MLNTVDNSWKLGGFNLVKTVQIFPLNFECLMVRNQLCKKLSVYTQLSTAVFHNLFSVKYSMFSTLSTRLITMII